MIDELFHFLNLESVLTTSSPVYYCDRVSKDPAIANNDAKSLLSIKVDVRGNLQM